MMNILASLAIVAVVKLAFLWVFVPKSERLGYALRPATLGEKYRPLVESHDGRTLGSPLRSESQRLDRLNATQMDSQAYAFHPTEQFMEGR
jgi:hypothetical protein